MRYAALITCRDIADFGPHRMFTDEGRQIRYRFADETLFALAQYILSLEPPRNPNLGDPRSAAGRRVFEHAGCGGCHARPGYTITNSRLLLGSRRNRIIRCMRTSGPSRLERTRIWRSKRAKAPDCIRSHRCAVYGTGACSATMAQFASLEEWFDPARLRDDFVPSGFEGYKVTHRAVPGHEFGLNLNGEDKAALIAFLKTL